MVHCVFDLASSEVRCTARCQLSSCCAEQVWAVAKGWSWWPHEEATNV